MKTLLVSLNYFPPQVGGISTLMFEVAKSLGDDNVCLTGVASKKKYNGRKVYRFQSIVSKNRYVCLFSLALSLFYILIRNKPDLLIIATVDDVYIGYWIYKYFKIPYVIWAHGNEILYLCNSSSPWPTALKGLKSASKVFAVSRYTAEKVESLGVEGERIKIIHPGCDIKKFKIIKNVDMSQLLGKNIPNNMKILITVANLVKRKGHDKVIESLPSILEKQTNLIYLIVGEGRDKRYLQDLAIRHNVEDNIIFFGRASDEQLVKLYSGADIFVMPSRNREKENDVEGFGIVYLEANCCEVPVIGGKSGGIPDAIEHGKSGFLVDPQNTEELSEKILTLLTDESMREQMADYGRKRVVSQFAWEIMGKNVRREIQKVIAQYKKL